jgi:formate hydrogenlyase transcriptional activator
MVSGPARANLKASPNEQLDCSIDETRARTSLLSSENDFRVLYEKSPVGICLVETHTGRFLKGNARFREIVGRSEAELLSLDVRAISHPDDIAEGAEKMRRLAAGEVDHFEIERRFLRPDGTIRWALESVVKTSSEEDMPLCNMATIQDITDRKQAEAALRTSEAHFRMLIEQASDGIFLSDHQGRYLDVNSAGAAMLGYSKEEILQRCIADIVVPGEVSRIEPEIHRFAGGTITRIEWQFLRKDGSVFPGEVTGQELPDGRLQGIVRDLTDRRSREEALRESEKRLAGLVATAMDAIITVDSSQRIVLFNTAAEKIFGCPASEALGQPLYRFIPERFRAAHNDHLRHFAGTGTTSRAMGALGELWAMRADGQEFPIEASISQLAVSGEKVLTLILRDISDRKLAEEAQRRSEERYRSLVEASAQIVWTSPPDGKQHGELSPKWQRFTGQTTQEMSGYGWLNAIHPDDRDRTAETWERAVAAGETCEVENRLRRHDGTYRDMLVRAVPVRDAAGALVEWVGMHIDVTEKKQAEEELRRAKDKLAEEKLYLEQEISSFVDGDLIGHSQALKDVMHQVAKVAPSNATVLLLGETGTGKELVARAVHRMSRRCHTSFIKMNCAAIPSGLLESELFGHEKGAFTSAVSRKLGRLELADRGTLFLDEIAEIPLELQPKLLRVLQDQEFERLGSTHTLKVDFRLIAATNVDLPQMVRVKKFRSDLYYRIHIFPIRMPPLRERSEDIPLLVEHFVKKFAARMTRSITNIPARTMDALTHCRSPGNIRELENFIERSVILTRGETLTVPLSELLLPAAEAIEDNTLKAAERAQILSTLRDSGGQLSGPRGAAARLGLPRTTLQSKLKQLGIDYRQFRT